MECYHYPSGKKRVQIKLQRAVSVSRSKSANTDARLHWRKFGMPLSRAVGNWFTGLPGEKESKPERSQRWIECLIGRKAGRAEVFT